MVAAEGSASKIQPSGLGYTSAYSFGTGPRSPKARFITKDHEKEKVGIESPGPVYNITSRLGDAPRYTMRGTSPRKSAAASPGPIYQVRDKIGEAPKYGFGSASRDMTRVSLDEKQAKTELAGKLSPGPANYETRSSLNGPYHGFGTQSRDARLGDDVVPGPGSYEISTNQTLHGRLGDAPQYRIGHAEREAERARYVGKQLAKDNLSKDTPGPGAYELRGSVGDGTEVTFKKAPHHVVGTHDRFRLAKSSHVPGPGAYERLDASIGMDTQMSNTSPRPKFGNEARMNYRSTSAPGPGAYNSRTSIGDKTAPGWGFGSSQQRPKNAASRSPGPVYSTVAGASLEQAPHFSFGTAARGNEHVFISPKHSLHDMAGKLSPGPIYQPTSHLGETPAWGFGTHPRSSSKVAEGGVPGPGSYNLRTSMGDSTDVVFHKEPNYRIGTSEREKEQAARFMSKDHAKDWAGKDTPGTGQYDPAGTIGHETHKTLHKLPEFGFGTSERDKSENVRFLSPEHAAKSFIGKDTPGPGAYDQALVMSRPWLTK